MIDAKTKQLWIDALRSGRYTQGKGQLKKEVNGVTCHCNLGVLAEELSWEFSETGSGIIREGNYQGYLPFEELLGEKIMMNAYFVNDRAGATFEDCARWVERLRCRK